MSVFGQPGQYCIHFKLYSSDYVFLTAFVELIFFLYLKIGCLSEQSQLKVLACNHTCSGFVAGNVSKQLWNVYQNCSKSYLWQ